MHTVNYPIEYRPSFVLFWGISLASAIVCGGVFLFALVCLMILVLISHEHAHLKECQRLGAQVDRVVFNAFGGQVHFKALTVSDTISICRAGVMDSLKYAAVFVIIWCGTNFLRYNSNPISQGWNFANAAPGTGLLYYMRFLNGIVLFTVILVLSNVLPIVYNSKKHGMITTDGWATVILREVEGEMWNDGRVMAAMV